MQIRKRLKAIASLVDKGSKVIDVGCDHALLDIYLTLYNSNMCIASDVNENAYMIAKNNIEKYGLSMDIPVICSNGFDKIEMQGDYTAIICGMGTSTILNILNTPKLKYLNTLIIQTNNDIYTIRREVSRLGYCIQNELVVKERGIFYVIIRFVRGKAHYNFKQLYFGPILRIKKTPDILEYFTYLFQSNQQILSKLPKKYYLKKWKFQYLNYLLKKELH